VIDIRYLRSEPDTVRELMARRNKPELIGLLDEALGFDGRMREITAERDAIRQQVNELSKQVGALRRARHQAAHVVTHHLLHARLA